MVEAIVSMVLQQLAQPVVQVPVPMIQKQVTLLINSPGDQVKVLASKLKKIQLVLRDAERRGLTDAPVKSWLDDLLDISYDIDDVLDKRQWEMENIRLQREDASPDPWKKVKYFIQSACSSFGIFERRKINLNINKLNERLDRIDRENEYVFKFLPNLSHDHSQDIKRTETTSFVNVSEVYGRDDDMEFLVSELLYESSSGSSQTKNEFPVISIVGGGGMGKTTLAQLVCNDKRIKDHFEVKIWVCVSDPFDEIKIAKAILEEIHKKSPDVAQFQTLLRCIEDDLSGKKFLLVLDDVWTEDGTKWKPFREALKSGAPDSRILVTTRKTTVAQAMGSSQRHIRSLNQISELDSWRMLSEIAFQDGRKEYERKILKDIGWEIAKKCKGLPLAIKVIGSLLQSKNGEEEWRHVLESPWWEWDEVQKDIFGPLALSYDELHPVAKRCFSYCAIFPKDAYLEPDVLIRMWCAQGFLSSMTKPSNDDTEQKGREIFDNLAVRSLFQDFRKDFEGYDTITCKMHDIVHDFVQFLSKNECLIVENVDGIAISTDVRSACHLNLVVNIDEVDINSILIDNEKLRSFLTTSSTMPVSLLMNESTIPVNLFRHLKRVRVLFLRECFSEVIPIPSEIGSLIHSRYLDLRWNRIRELPEAICDLYNLETLILTECGRLSKFPQGIHKLRKLRHIFNEGTNKMEFPEGTEKLTNLRALSEIHASSRTNWKNLEFLRNMNKLGGSLKISVEGLDEENANNHHILLEAAEKTKLKNKKFIQRLVLRYSGKVPIEVVEALQPHPKLEELRFEGPYLPKWLTTLTNLEELCISITEGMKIPNIYTFPKLKKLFFTGCLKLEEWEDLSEEEENNINLSIFPSLEELRIWECPKLTALPHRLLRKSPSLKVSHVPVCEKLKGRYQDWQRVPNIHRISYREM